MPNKSSSLSLSIVEDAGGLLGGRTAAAGVVFGAGGLDKLRGSSSSDTEAALVGLGGCGFGAAGVSNISSSDVGSFGFATFAVVVDDDGAGFCFGFSPKNRSSSSSSSSSRNFDRSILVGAGADLIVGCITVGAGGFFVGLKSPSSSSSSSDKPNISFSFFGAGFALVVTVVEDAGGGLVAVIPNISPSSSSSSSPPNIDDFGF